MANVSIPENAQALGMPAHVRKIELLVEIGPHKVGTILTVMSTLAAALIEQKKAKRYYAPFQKKP